MMFNSADNSNIQNLIFANYNSCDNRRPKKRKIIVIKKKRRPDGSIERTRSVLGQHSEPLEILSTTIPASEKETKDFKIEARKLLLEIKTNYNTKIEENKDIQMNAEEELQFLKEKQAKIRQLNEVMK